MDQWNRRYHSVVGLRDEGGTRWLSATELAGWRAFSNMLIVVPAELDAQMCRRTGLNEFEYHVLVALSERPDRRMRIGALAALAHGSQSRMSHLVKRLEQQGFVGRERDPADGRSIVVSLTDAGMAKLTATAPHQVDIVQRTILDALTAEELEQLGRLSARLLTHNAETCADKDAESTGDQNDSRPT